MAANLTILKSPTVLRQPDGKLWAWEGCFDAAGCCPGSCTHVWNYAQALPHLFPDLERSLRETEFGPSQDDARPSGLPCGDPHPAGRARFPRGRRRPTRRDHEGASRVAHQRRHRVAAPHLARGEAEPALLHRDVGSRISRGVLVEPHHNTYDIEFWGPDGMCTSFYLGALAAAAAMAARVGDDATVYEVLLAKGRAFMERELWDGEYFIQQIVWEGLRAPNPTDAQSFHTQYSPEASALLAAGGAEVPVRSRLPLGWGARRVARGVLWGRASSWIRARSPATCGRSTGTTSGAICPSTPTRSGRPTPWATRRGCSSAPGRRAGSSTLPFVYSNEVWTGIEYQVASHLMMSGQVAEGLEIVRAVRDRYDGRVRNPFNEYECGHWYARAMASYGLLQGLTGARYDAVEKTLYLRPSVAGRLPGVPLARRPATARWACGMGGRSWRSSAGDHRVRAACLRAMRFDITLVAWKPRSRLTDDTDGNCDTVGSASVCSAAMLERPASRARSETGPSNVSRIQVSTSFARGTPPAHTCRCRTARSAGWSDRRRRPAARRGPSSRRCSSRPRGG